MSHSNKLFIELSTKYLGMSRSYRGFILFRTEEIRFLYNIYLFELFK